MPSLSEITNGRMESLRRGDTVGIVGGGQLGRMMAIAARYMGFRTGVLDPVPGCPAAQAADFQVVAGYDDRSAIRKLAERSDVLTYEFENVDADALDEVADITAIPQGTDLLRVTQNRIAEKSFINSHGIRTAPWKAVGSRQDLAGALEQIGYPAILKTAAGGYDGHGQTVLRGAQDLGRVPDAEGFPESVLEGFVDFEYEASILVSGNGRDYVTFPVVRNEHRNNILHMTFAPAQAEEGVCRRAKELALNLARGFNLIGTLAIELFITHDGNVLVNELAPRPHNSGHYTIEACSFSQYDAHIRGIAGWSLEQPKLLSPAVMVNVLGQHVGPVQRIAPNYPQWHVHDYGKAEAKHNRKMGHITVLADDTQQAAQELAGTHCWDDILG